MVGRRSAPRRRPVHSHLAAETPARAFRLVTTAERARALASTAGKSRVEADVPLEVMRERLERRTRGRAARARQHLLGRDDGAPAGDGAREAGRRDPDEAIATGYGSSTARTAGSSSPVTRRPFAQSVRTCSATSCTRARSARSAPHRRERAHVGPLCRPDRGDPARRIRTVTSGLVGDTAPRPGQSSGSSSTSGFRPEARAPATSARAVSIDGTSSTKTRRRPQSSWRVSTSSSPARWARSCRRSRPDTSPRIRRQHARVRRRPARGHSGRCPGSWADRPAARCRSSRRAWRRDARAARRPR